MPEDLDKKCEKEEEIKLDKRREKSKLNDKRKSRPRNRKVQPL